MNGKLLGYNIEGMQKKDGMINLSVTVVAIVLCSILLVQISVQTTSAQLPLILIPLVSTREHFRLDSGELRTDQHNTTDYTHLDIPGLDGGSDALRKWPFTFMEFGPAKVEQSNSVHGSL